MNIDVIIKTIELGLILSILSLGLFISFRILNTPDLTVDGSFVTGMCISGIMVSLNYPFLGIVLAFGLGVIAGAITGLIHTKLNVHPILAGIITMSALYSVNIRIIGKKPNLSLYGYQSIFSNGLSIMIIFIIVTLILMLLYLFLKTQIGLSLQATGDNEEMVRSSSINTDFTKVIGLALANGLVALSGGILAQYQSLADVNSGIGMLVIGITSIILGESLFKRKGLMHNLISVIIGSVLYRFIIFIALNIGLDGSDLKLFSSLILIVAILIPILQKKGTKIYARNK